MPREKGTFREPNEKEIETIIKMYKEKKSLEEIAISTGFLKSTIRKCIILESDIKIPIDEEESKYFKELYKKDKTLFDISNITGRSIESIRPHLNTIIQKRRKKELEKRLKEFHSRISDMKDYDVIKIYMDCSYNISDIAKGYEESEELVRAIIENYVNTSINYENLFKKPIRSINIKIFRDFFCEIGKEYYINIYSDININSHHRPKKLYSSKKIIIKTKYPKIIITEEGETYSYNDILSCEDNINKNEEV